MGTFRGAFRVYPAAALVLGSGGIGTGAGVEFRDQVVPGRAIVGEIYGIMSTMSLFTISCANKKLRTELEAKWKHTS